MANENLFHWRALTTAANELPAPPQFLIDKVFGGLQNAIQHFAEYLDIDIERGGRTIGPFVSPLSGGKVVTNLGREMKSIRFPRIRPKKQLSAPELLSMRAPGFTAYDAERFRQAQRRKIAQELADLKNRAIRSIEWMCAQSLQGAITIDEEDYQVHVDFQLPADHKPVLSGTALWTDASSTPLEDLLEWSGLISDKIGFRGDLVILGKEAAKAFRKHENVMQRMNLYRGTARMAMEPEKDAIYIGHVDGLDVYEYRKTYNDAEGNSHPYIPDNAAIVIASSAKFQIHFGMVLDLSKGQNLQIPEFFFAKSWLEEDPSTRWLLLETRPLPVPHQIEAIVFATVV